MWEKRQNFNGEVTTKQHAMAVPEDNTPADDRKMRELHGNSEYQPLKKQFWKQQEKNYAEPQVLGTTTRKAAELTSHLFSNEETTARLA